LQAQGAVDVNGHVGAVVDGREKRPEADADPRSSGTSTFCTIIRHEAEFRGGRVKCKQIAIIPVINEILSGENPCDVRTRGIDPHRNRKRPSELIDRLRADGQAVVDAVEISRSRSEFSRRIVAAARRAGRAAPRAVVALAGDIMGHRARPFIQWPPTDQTG